MVGCKENIILDLTFPLKGQWWMSLEMNNLDSIHNMLAGNRVLHVPESSSLMCYEMVQNDQLIIKGSLDCAWCTKPCT